SSYRRDQLGDRLPVCVRQVDVQHAGKGRRKVHDRYRASECAGLNAWTHRNEQAASRMIARAAKTVLAFDLTDLIRAEPDLVDGRIARPFDEKIGQVIAILAGVQHVGPDHVFDGTLTRIEIDE